eukprot:CAMPEP_0172479698 /NCGR_PEP_ID=MMETSP1066-20121228/4472_1 /TAXON_ID=671091 /ORGANISM="Coscinodiscus wailesii, Strain CCMP2513" /LENGTH=85 /DNA_ID=CAMNT_0013240397 /DNA_START=1 /DNA_END=255 /DNA_ORIENTATION=+
MAAADMKLNAAPDADDGTMDNGVMTKPADDDNDDALNDNDAHTKSTTTDDNDTISKVTTHHDMAMDDNAATKHVDAAIPFFQKFD